MRERIPLLGLFVRRWGWICLGITLALVLTGALALAASGSVHQSATAGAAGGVHVSSHVTPPPARGTPAAASGSAAATQTPSLPPPPTVLPLPPTSPTAKPDGSLALTCTVHLSAGDEDDSENMALICTVTHAPQSDTSFNLGFGVLDPLGQVHAFTQPCGGTLRDGSGSCSQSYTFIFPFPATPAPVAGQSLPSRQQLGPTTPTVV